MSEMDYDRITFVRTLTAHQRLPDGSCTCGHGRIPNGRGSFIQSSYTAHVANLYEQARREAWDAPPPKYTIVTT